MILANEELPQHFLNEYLEKHLIKDKIQVENLVKILTRIIKELL